MTETGIKVLGMLSARWRDQSKEKSINIMLFSSGESSGLFVDEGEMKDAFLTGIMPGQTSPSTISYRGIYRSGTGIKAISGKAGVWVAPIGPSATMTMIVAMIYKPDNTPLATIIWVPQDFTNTNPPLTLHAADIFKHSVKITQSR